MNGRSVLVLGASGYVGARLVSWLLARGALVRAVARSVEALRRRPWAAHARVSLFAADARDTAGIRKAAEGCAGAYYLVHSMLSGEGDFAEADRQAAASTARALSEAGVERLVYLGGLGRGERLSAHLSSRQEVGEILRGGRASVTELRAAMIIGSGSASFEILRYLVDRLPLMMTPRWVRTPCQPIAIRNVIEYLGGCLERPETAGGLYEIGGPDVTDYRRLMEIYAREAGLRRRLIVPVPVLTPRLSSAWIGLVTPAPGRLAGPLAAGLSHPVVCRDERLRGLIPQKLLDCREAIRAALTQRGALLFPSAQAEDGMPPVEWRAPGDPRWTGGTVFRDERRIDVPVSPEAAWKPIRSLGGAGGWYHSQWLWRFRGWIDRLLGGPGMGEGRPNGETLHAGDPLDCWTVVEALPERRLLLRARMKLPGEASLEFRVEPLAAGGARIAQAARFLPRGLAGVMYWWAAYPLHVWVFSGLLRQIGLRAVNGEGKKR